MASQSRYTAHDDQQRFAGLPRALLAGAEAEEPPVSHRRLVSSTALALCQHRGIGYHNSCQRQDSHNQTSHEQSPDRSANVFVAHCTGSAAAFATTLCIWKM
jgi:hypothetical protein